MDELDEKLPQQSVAEASKRAEELGWNWFKYHAEQRMIMFRYYLIVIGLCITAFAAAIRENPLISLLIAGFAAVASVLFGALDWRVSKLVKLGENVLRDEQARLGHVLGYDSIHITNLANAPSNHWVGQRIGSYTKAFRVLFVSVVVLFLLAGSYAAVRVFQSDPPEHPPLTVTPAAT